MAFAPALAAAALAGARLFPSRDVALRGALDRRVAGFAAGRLVAEPADSQAPSRLSENQHRFLEKLSRKTWRYFEEFVTAEDHWLPPDNIQQNPRSGGRVAHQSDEHRHGVARRSGGLRFRLLLGRAVSRTHAARTFETLSRMERYRGHFFNWYDTRTLAPLLPCYVSMVDSGNLAANLLVLRSGCQELSEARVLPPRMFGGLRDTLRVLLDVARGTGAPLVGADVLRKIERQIEDLDQAPRRAGRRQRLAVAADGSSRRTDRGDGSDAELAWWAGAYERSCNDHQTDLLHLAAWLALPAPPDALGQHGFRRAGRVARQVARVAPAAGHRGHATGCRERANCGAAADRGGAATASAEVKDWLERWSAALALASERAGARIAAFERVAVECGELADMDFGLLYDSTRDLFAIGYNVSERRMDAGFYDLLASEARLASFVVIAQGDFGQEHWFALGRLLTTCRQRAGAVELERLDVRVLDAAAGHAQL
jgi:cyclic beta-1,2-glucan synthetase